MEYLNTPFLNDAKKGIGCKAMSDGATEEYVMAVMMETSGHKIPIEELRNEKIFAIEVLMKRIEAMQLPISFTPTGLIAAYALVENNPGRAVVLLIDCLTAFEGKTVTAAMLADLYPYGFYSEETFMKYVDDYLKNVEKRSQIKWASIY